MLVVPILCLVALAMLALSVPRPAFAEEEAVRKVAAPTIVRYVVREDEDHNWHTIADWPQGADIPYMLVGTLPEDLAERKTLAYCLVAAPGEGLTYLDGSARVTLVHASGATEDVTSALEVACEGGAIAAGSKDILQAVPGLVATDMLRLTYDARLNDAAHIGLEAGNESWAHLEYTEGPAVRGSASVSSHIATSRIFGLRGLLVAAFAAGPWRDGLSKSPEVKTTVYTYTLQVEKVDEKTGEPLAGATFALRDADGLWYRAASGEEPDPEADDWVADVADATTRTTASGGVATFDFVDSVRYELVELKAPEGYLKVDPVDVTLETGAAGTATTLAARSEAGEVRSVNAGAGTVLLRVADPVDADNHTRPTRSSNPTGTTNPTSSTDPSDPTDNTSPAGPTDAADPAEPAGPIDSAGGNAGDASVAAGRGGSVLSRLGDLLAKTGDAALRVWPALIVSVLALLCGLALRRGRGRRNTH